MFGNNPAFGRGKEWARIRRKLTAQRALTPTHLKLREQLIEGAIIARRSGTGTDDTRLRQLMTEWLIIHEAIGGD